MSECNGINDAIVEISVQMVSVDGISFAKLPQSDYDLAEDRLREALQPQQLNPLVLE